MPKLNKSEPQMEPTPRSLRIVEPGNGPKCQPAIILGNRLRIIVDHSEDFGDPLPTADLIVRAVNSHDDLLEALKATIPVLGRAGGTGDIIRLGKQVITAIARAEGREVPSQD